MLRGKTNRTSIMSGLLLCSLTFLVSPPADGGSPSRALSSNTGKLAAPSKEDGIDYFATFRKDISPEDAKQADELRLKTISSIKSILSDKKNSRNEYELTLRLGELYVERADYLRDLEIKDYIKSYDTWEAQAESKRAKNPPKANYKRSENSLYQAAQTFRKIATKYPKHPRSDATIYSLARTLSRLNDDNAAQYYTQMIKNHPKSKLIPDAWLALGELHFDKHRLKDATTAYQNVLKFKSHRAYPYAVYKLGWCFYNNQGINEKKPQENLNKSLAAFQLVIKLSEKQKATNFNLRDEALRDIVMVFAELEDTDKAWAYFKKIGETDRFYATLERLGNMYTDAGKTGQAIETFTRLVNESPTRKNNPQIYKRLVALHDRNNKFPEVVKTIKSMQLTFVNDSSWTNKNSADKKTLEEARTTTERTMHRYGTIFHSRGQKIKDKNLEALAAEIYTMYLESFDKLEPAYELRFYLADIQLSQKKYAAASANFIAVAKQKPKNGKYLKDAALNAVESMSLWAQSEKFSPVPPPGQATKPITVPKVKKLYADAIDFYVNLLPNEKSGLPMRFTAAQIFFDYGHYPEALKRFDSLATNHSSSKQGQASARLILGYFNERTDWQNVIAYGKKYQINKSLNQDQKVKGYIESSLRTALFNSALAYEKTSDHVKAAAAFMEFQKMFPSDKNADRALFNASVNQFKSGDVEQSLATQRTLLSMYPKSKLCPDVMANMAETYEATAQLKKAAEAYRQLAAMFPNDQRAPTSLYNSAVLQRGINNSGAAISAFNSLSKIYPNHKLAADALLESAKTSEEIGDIQAAINSYRNIIKRDDMRNTNDGLFAQAKSVELRLQLDPKNEKARKDLTKINNQLRSKSSLPAPAARVITARILFQDQEPLVRSFNQIQLSTVEDVESKASNKQARLVRLANAYENIVGLGNAEYAVASYYRLGELHEAFATALFNVPTPGNYSPKEASDLKSQLERSAFPLKEQAYKFYETAYTQSSEVDSLSPWTVKTYQKMSALAPAKHPEMKEITAEPGYVTSKIAISAATENLAH